MQQKRMKRCVHKHLFAKCKHLNSKSNCWIFAAVAHAEQNDKPAQAAQVAEGETETQIERAKPGKYGPATSLG